MTDEFLEEDDGGFEGFEDFLFGLHPGHTAGIGSGLRYREGGDARDWSSPGATKRVPGNWMMQIGVIDDTFAAASSGMIEVTFPQAFVDPPWVTGCAVNTLPAFQAARIQACVSSAASVELYWSTAPLNVTYIALSWMAIGPVGTG